MVDDTFVGRENELQALRNYVGVVTPSIWERLRAFVGRESQPPLVIWGPGGIGKTALVGKFLLEHVNAPKAGWFPFAYITFDSETLNIREPFTVLVAVTGQLEYQISEGPSGTAARAAISQFRKQMGQYRGRRVELQRRAGRTQNRGAVLSSAERNLYAAFGSMLREIAQTAGAEQGASRVPVLLVFDSFEEVYYRTSEELLGFWRMLEAAQKGFPLLRIVIVGRAQPRASWIGNSKIIEQPLDNLSPPDAQRLLLSLGVKDAAIAQTIAKQVGGSPLTLRLAARVAQTEDASDGITGLETRRYWLFSVAQNVVQGQLYRRILDHIHDPDVRALAHPGMVLRRITAGVIQQVLAPVCGLGEITRDRAEELFELLRREHALVSIESDSSLKYREEVRRPVLVLLMNDRPDRVRSLQEVAVRYYENRSELVDRAEEIYNRLMLKQSEWLISERWMPGVEGFLASTVSELPVEQQIWLASRMSIELSAETYQLADQAHWERLIGRKALEAFRYSGPKNTIDMLRQRTERSADSPLFAIEARAWLALDQPREAIALLDRALDNYPTLANPGRFAELLWLRAQAALRLPKLDEAYAFLERLIALSSTLTSALVGVQALSEILVISRTIDATETALDQQRQLLAFKLSEVTDADIQKEKDLLRLAIVRLGSDYPATISRIAPRVADQFIDLWKNGEIESSEIVKRLAQRPELLRYLSVDIGKFSSSQNEFLEHAIRQIVEMVARNEVPELSGLLIEIFDSEGATLSGASLAGLDAYREMWELEAASEAVA
jgi:tetratricopeptide (TPR) repeat protein